MWKKKQLIVIEGKKDASRKVLQLSVGSSVPKGHGRSWELTLRSKEYKRSGKPGRHADSV